MEPRWSGDRRASCDCRARATGEVRYILFHETATAGTRPHVPTARRVARRICPVPQLPLAPLRCRVCGVCRVRVTCIRRVNVC
jgi:hypothetical protein